MADKLGRFTQRARRVLSLAQEEAEKLNLAQVGTEHLLLGMIREEEGVAGKALRNLGLTQQAITELVVRMSQDAPKLIEGNLLELSLGTKRAIELAIDEQRRIGRPFVGTEHLLLGLVREWEEGGAVAVLKSLGISPDEVPRQVRLVLAPFQSNLFPHAKSPQMPISVSRGESPTASARLVSANFEPHVHSRFLMKLLSDLAQSLNETEKLEMQRVLKKVYEEVISARPYSQEVMGILLDRILAPFKPPKKTQPQLRFRITDKVTGELKAELSMSVTQARGLLPIFAEALKNGQTGKLLVMDDITERIEISIDDETQAGTEE